MVGEAELVVCEVLGKYLRTDSKVAIITIIIKIQIFFLMPFNIAPFSVLVQRSWDFWHRLGLLTSVG